MCKTLHGQGPVYVADLLRLHCCSRPAGSIEALRSWLLNFGTASVSPLGWLIQWFILNGCRLFLIISGYSSQHMCIWKCVSIKECSTICLTVCLNVQI